MKRKTCASALLSLSTSPTIAEKPTKPSKRTEKKPSKNARCEEEKEEEVTFPPLKKAYTKKKRPRTEGSSTQTKQEKRC